MSHTWIPCAHFGHQAAQHAAVAHIYCCRSQISVLFHCPGPQYPALFPLGCWCGADTLQGETYLGNSREQRLKSLTPNSNQLAS
eukprot:358392-Chlamydomonas_euryale.AAC.9